MKNLILPAVFILVLSFTSTGETNAQRRFVDHSVIEGVDIQYRWANSKFFDRNSPLELRLKMKNNNDYPIRITWDIEFYMGPKLIETNEETEVCINPKLARTGRINGMFYRSSNLNNRQLESDEFNWEITNIEIERVESCR